MSLSTIIWNVSPNLISITESYAIRWYGVLFSLGYVLSYFILLRAFQKEKLPIKLLEKITFAAIVGGVVGARLGHCFFYEPFRYINNPIKILYVWEGGLASHGGAIGVLIAFWIVLRNETTYSKAFVLSRALLVVPLAGACIRIGNLMNSEIYGNETTLPWGFTFKNSTDVVANIEVAVPRHPTQLYEAIAYLLLFAYLQYYYWKQLRNKKEISEYYIIGIFLIGLFGARVIIEFFKLNQVSFENSLFLNMGQILSLPFIILGILALIKHFKPKKQEIL